MRPYSLLFFILPLLVLPASCAKQEVNMPPITDADRAEIRFTPQDGQPVEVTVTDTARLKVLGGLVTIHETPAYKCGYDGRIVFSRKNEQLLDGSFNLSPDCRHIYYADLADPERYHSRKLSAEGAELLEKLRDAHWPDVRSKWVMLDFFLGKWMQEEGEGAVSYEEWERKDAETFTGRAYTVRGSDTAWSETLELRLEGDDVWYIPTIPENEGPVRFKMTDATETGAVFENPGHDFPQVISYKLEGDTVLHARIAGKRDGQTGSKDFFLRKAEE